MYDVFNTSYATPIGKTKWNNTLNLNDIQWKRIFTMPFRSKKDSKLQWLQFRVNHHIVVTNKFLFKIGKTESQLCAFCQTEIASIYHLFWNCIFVKQFIRDLETVLDQNDTRFNFRDISFLCGSLDTKATSVPHNITVMTFKNLPGCLFIRTFFTEEFLYPLT